MKVFRIIRDFFQIRIVLNQKSYYPDLKRKSKLKRWLENAWWILKYHELNKFYNLYGFDVYRDINQNDYIAYHTFKKERNKKNGLKEAYSYIVILRDKNVFEKYMTANNINTVKNIAIIKDGVVYDSYLLEKIEENKIFNDKKCFFIKALADECGKGIFCIDSYLSYKKIKDKFDKGIFIVQEKIIQHKDMMRLNSKSINTIRIITVRNKENDIDIFGILLRIGTEKSGYVDNSSQGGIVVPVSLAGRLNEYGFSKPGYGGLIKCHPDSNIVFSEFKIPYFKEAISLVKKAHKSLYNIHSIGWDVAITPDGPLLIEGNDNWEIQSIQAIGGLKKEWNKYL